MGKGLIRVSYDLLRHALYLPEDTIILAIRDAQDNFRTEPGTWFEIKLVHPDLPDADEFEMLRFHNPQFGSVLEDGEHYVPKFLGWNE